MKVRGLLTCGNCNPAGVLVEVEVTPRDPLPPGVQTTPTFRCHFCGRSMRFVAQEDQQA